MLLKVSYFLLIIISKIIITGKKQSSILRQNNKKVTNPQWTDVIIRLLEVRINVWIMMNVFNSERASFPFWDFGLEIIIKNPITAGSFVANIYFCRVGRGKSVPLVNVVSEGMSQGPRREIIRIISLLKCTYWTRDIFLLIAFFTNCMWR